MREFIWNRPVVIPVSGERTDDATQPTIPPPTGVPPSADRPPGGGRVCRAALVGMLEFGLDRRVEQSARVVPEHLGSPAEHPRSLVAISHCI